MNKFFTFLMTFCLAFGFATAQESVTVTTGAGYANDIYYSLTDGEAGSATRANYDLAFSINQTSAIRVNTSAGASVWVVSEDPADFATVDTTGQLTDANEYYNSSTTWLSGALNAPADTSEFSDVGWGDYDLQTHTITASRVFVVQDVAGDYYKLMIDERAAGIYEFTFANLDGSNETTETIDVADYSGKNFAYYSFANGALDREPATIWDLLFTQYTTGINTGPGGIVYYGVSGVLSNAGVQVAQVEGVDPATYEDYQIATYSEDIDVIGSDWKSFDMASASFQLEDSLVYFIRANDASYWKLVFTAFTGSSAGAFTFDKTELQTSSRPEAGTAVLGVYPNPATDHVNLMLDGISGPANVMITDLSGRVVQRHTLNANGFGAQRLDVSELNTGLYILTLEADGQRLTQRLSIR